MRWLIFFFCVALLGIVAAEDVEVEVTDPVNRTYDAVQAEEGYSPILGYGLLAFGGILLIYISYRNSSLSRVVKKPFMKKPFKSKNIFHFFSFSRKSKEGVLVSQLGKASQREHEDKEELQKLIDKAYAYRDTQQEFVTLKEDIKQEYPKILDEDIKKVLRITDDLLGKMPDDLVHQFVHSEDFEVYKKVLKKVYEPLQENKGELEKLEKVLGLLEQGLIDGDEARRMLGLPVRHLQAQKIEKKDKGGVLEELKKVRNEGN